MVSRTAQPILRSVCVNIFSRGKRAVVTGDMMHHVIQCREPDWDPKQSAQSRRFKRD
jgi:hypothetical protein